MENKCIVAVLLGVLLMRSPCHARDQEKCCPCGEGTSAAVAAAVGVGTTILAPFLLPVIGFTAGGIGAGTLAAKGMSLAATSGVGGSVIAGLQSAATATGAYKIGAAAGAYAYKATRDGCCNCN